MLVSQTCFHSVARFGTQVRTKTQKANNERSLHQKAIRRPQKIRIQTKHLLLITKYTNPPVLLTMISMFEKMAINASNDAVMQSQEQTTSQDQISEMHPYDEDDNAGDDYSFHDEEEMYTYDEDGDAEDDYSFHEDGNESDTEESTREEEFESSIVHPKMDFTDHSSSSSADSGNEGENKVEDTDGWTPPEGEGACFSTYAFKCRQLKDDPLRPFRSYCQSSDFSDFIRECGVGFSKFKLNDKLVEGGKIHDRFVNLLKTKSTSDGEIVDNACLSVVFHGTPTRNIEAILENGLDPKKRYGQAYGPGVRVRDVLIFHIIV